MTGQICKSALIFNTSSVHQFTYSSHSLLAGALRSRPLDGTFPESIARRNLHWTDPQSFVNAFMKSLITVRAWLRFSVKSSTDSSPVVPVRSARQSTAPLAAPQTSPQPANPPPRTDAICMQDSLKPGSIESLSTRIITLSAQLNESPFFFSKECNSSLGRKSLSSKALLRHITMFPLIYHQA